MKSVKGSSEQVEDQTFQLMIMPLVFAITFAITDFITYTEWFTKLVTVTVKDEIRPNPVAVFMISLVFGWFVGYSWTLFNKNLIAFVAVAGVLSSLTLVITILVWLSWTPMLSHMLLIASVSFLFTASRKYWLASEQENLKAQSKRVVSGD